MITKYVGETGDSAYHRQTEHARDIMRKETSNAFAKHLEAFHPDKAGDKSVFKIKTEAMFRKCVERQCHEGVMIQSSKDKVDVLLNSKSEWHDPGHHRERWRRLLQHHQEESQSRKMIELSSLLFFRPADRSEFDPRFKSQGNYGKIY